MLTEWIVSNFKSIDHPTVLKLAPLTLLAGSNSSGKSTLIQSILLVCQSLTANSESEPLIFNGPLVQLGGVGDVLHAGNRDDTMHIGFGFLQQKPNGLVFRVESKLRQKMAPQAFAKHNKRISLGLEHTKVNFARYDVPESRKEIDFYATPDSRIDPRFFNSESASSSSSVDLLKQIESGQYDYKITGLKEQELVRQPYQEWIAGVGRLGIIPNRLLIAYDLDLRQLDDDIAWLSNVLPYISSSNPSKTKLSPLLVDVFDRIRGNPEKLDLIRHYVRSNAYHLYRDDFVRYLYKNAIDGHVSRDLARRLVSAASVFKRERTYSRTNRDKSLIGYEVQLFPLEYAQVFDEIRKVISEQIYYLGPLRETPRVLSSNAPFGQRPEVGNQGEYTAAMLDEYRNMIIKYCLPPENDSAEMEVQKGPLIHALTVWLRRMGLVDAVDTEETPRVGYKLTVKDNKVGKSLDLTNVGVGISQVLPTLVLALLSPEGSTLLFEQPELHLHPKVQSVLGDFFLGMTYIGKQCIVETHSEYLINRLRRRVVEAPDDSVLKKLRIYFVEKEGIASKFREVDLNQYGVILDWPRGFFDESESESSIILRLQMEKRKKAHQSK